METVFETRDISFFIGMVLPYAGKTDADDIKKLESKGWYLCDGHEVKRKLMLYKVIGDIYGTGDGITTFNLPDYRGRFLRGVDDPTGKEPAKRDPEAKDRKGEIEAFIGNKVGSTQDDAMHYHTHDDKGHNHETWIADNYHDLQAGTDWRTIGRGNELTKKGHAELTDPVATSAGKPILGWETRPKNIYVNWIIYGGF
jgi:phage-related tail fiber protein